MYAINVALVAEQKGGSNSEMRDREKSIVRVIGNGEGSKRQKKKHYFERRKIEDIEQSTWVKV